MRYLTDIDWHDAVRLWNAGNDTHAIASYFGCSESQIFNGLPKWRQRMRRAA